MKMKNSISHPPVNNKSSFLLFWIGQGSKKRVTMHKAMANVRLHIASICLVALVTMLGMAGSVHAHSVGQVQTTKFLAPETVDMLVARAGLGTPGLQVGDTLSYIIQFSPVANAANVGAGGYITDYLPPGAEVIGASIVNKDSSGNFYTIPPSLPGGIDLGWGNRGQQTFGAPFNVSTYDSTGRCTAAGYTNNCNGRLTELYADTGIFFSTDPRTAVFPALPTRIQEATNGYNINPTGAGQLLPIMGLTNATTHNLWDANQTNAFGSTALAIAGLAAPKSSQINLITAGKIGQGTTPYNAGSAVAGPQTGYQLDDTGQVGPWQRIAYLGSRIGDNTLGPATAANNSTTAVGGSSTSIGWNLSSSNPLPSGTNAVRWAVGKLVVGELKYVKISLRITDTVPINGIINSSEVFGGDAADADDGKDNAWRYHVPSVADNNSNLYVYKNVICVYSGGVCLPSNGSYIPVNAKVRYRIVYMNTGNVNQTNVILSDKLPCQTAANPVSNITIISGPIGLPAPNPPVVPAGDCTTIPFTRQTFNFPTLATLTPGAGGSIELDVQTNAALNNTVSNTAKMVSTEIPLGVSSHANSYVQTAPNLVITKTTSTPTVVAGGTVSYTITVTNAGTANATAINVYDMLPTMGGAASANTRFSYSATTSIVLDPANPPGSVLPAPTVTTAVPPTETPYNTGGVSSNQQQVLWAFAGSTLVPGAKFTITFTVTVGASVTASATPYLNTAVVTYTGGIGRSDTTGVAGVTVTSPLSVTKSLESYYDTATASWVLNNGSNQIPVNARVRYKIDYTNTGGSAITNVILTDTLPCQTAAAPVSYNGVANTVNIVSGPITAPTVATLNAILAGNCATSTRQSFSFPTLATLNAGQTGQIKLDVQTNAAAGSIVVNTATLTGTGAAPASSEVQASVLSIATLRITKTASVSSVIPGQTLSYTLTVWNTGTAAANNMVLYDWLPTSQAANDVTTRFTFVAGSSTFVGSISPVAPTVNRPPTQAPYNNVPAGSNPNLNNQEEVVWNFGAQTLAPGAGFTVTFQSTVGINMLNPSSYRNYARVVYTGGQADSGASFVPTLVSLSDFSAYNSNGRFVIQWSTSSETDTAGFYLFRLDEKTGRYRQINSRLLPALLTSQQGGTYSLIDNGASLDNVNTYLLMEIEGKGRKNTYGPFAVTAGAGNAVENQYSFNPQAAAFLIKSDGAAGPEAKKVTRYVDSEGTLVISNSNSKPSRSADSTVVDEVSDYTRMAKVMSVVKKTALDVRAEAKAKAGFLKRLKSGTMVKIPVSKDGLYYTGSAEIASLLGLTDTNVKQLIKSGKLALSNQGNTIAYIPADGMEGLFFYGQGIDSMYTKENIYWLYKGKGLQMNSLEGNGPAPAGYSMFTETVHAEQDTIDAPVLANGPESDYWFWDYVIGGDPSLGRKLFELQAFGVADSSSEAVLAVNLHGVTATYVANEHHVSISLNGTVIGEDQWQGTQEHVVNLSFSQGLLYEGTNSIEVKGLLDAGVPYSVFFVDSFDLTYKRLLEAHDDSLTFSAAGALPLTVYGFTKPDLFVFDITHPDKPILNMAATIDSADGNYSVSFTPSPGSRYLAAASDAATDVADAWADSPSTLASKKNKADYIIITTKELAAAAQELADYRKGQKLKTMVVDLEDIMDEFNYGISSPKAIHAFLAYAYANWKKAPKYVLLAGDGTYDYKDDMGIGDNLVPTLMAETPDGLSPSDNLFADMDNDHVPDIAIGRLPVLTAEELRSVISKIIAYESSAGKRIVMLADNQDDGGNFPSDSNDVAALVPAGYSVGKIYLSSYTLEQARQLLFNEINNGTALLNYIGHAGVNILANEGLLKLSDVAAMQNSGKPFVLTAMTCTVGNFALPGYESLSEALITTDSGGAVAVWAPSGLSYNYLSKVLDEHFFLGAFGNRGVALGDVILNTFRNYRATGGPAYIMDIYNLQGDPALRMR